MARSRSAGAMTKAGRWRFCITKNGLEAVNVEDEVAAAPAEAPKAIASHKQIFVAAKKSARKKRRPDKSTTKTGSLREGLAGSKQARVLAMLGRPEGVMPERDRDSRSGPFRPLGSYSHLRMAPPNRRLHEEGHQAASCEARRQKEHWRDRASGRIADPRYDVLRDEAAKVAH
jgi:hypothetical protein